MGVFSLRQVLVNSESSFGEFISAPGSATFDTNIPITEAEFTAGQTRVDDAAFQSRLAVKRAGHKGHRSGTLRIKARVPGHNTAPTGALTTTWLHTLLGDALGGKLSNAAGTTLSAASSASSFTLTTSTNWGDGYIGRVGSKGDGRGDGQPFVASGVAADVVTALTALPATPNSSDVVYGCLLAFLTEGASLVTKRFAVMHSTTGAQFVLQGCQLASFDIEYDFEGMPMIELVYSVAYWETSAISFPNSTALSASNSAPNAGGSLFLQAVGTATRSVLPVATMKLSVELGLEPQIGPGGSAHYQNVCGWVRTAFDVKVTIGVPWTADWQTFWDTENASLTNKHLLFAANAGHGRVSGFYCPSMFPCGERPSVPVNVKEQDYVTFMLQATEGPDTDTALSRSSLRLFWS